MDLFNSVRRSPMTVEGSLGTGVAENRGKRADLGSTKGSKNVRPDCSLLTPGWVESISTQQWEVPLDFFKKIWFLQLVQFGSCIYFSFIKDVFLLASHATVPGSSRYFTHILHKQSCLCNLIFWRTSKRIYWCKQKCWGLTKPLWVNSNWRFFLPLCRIDTLGRA